MGFEYVNEWLDKLGIRWRVEILHDPNEDKARVLNNPHTLTHIIRVPNFVVNDPEGNSFEVAHEVIHCWLCETLDRIFSTIVLDKRLNLDNPQDARIANWVYLAQQLVDVWVNELIGYKLNKELVVKDAKSWTEITRTVLDKLGKKELEELRYEIILGYAINFAQIKREGIPLLDKKNKDILRLIDKKLGKQAEQQARELAELYANLPPLPLDDLEAAIALFSSKAARAAKILGLPIKPSIVKGDDEVFYWKHD